jgi:hypothetical protein
VVFKTIVRELLANNFKWIGFLGVNDSNIAIIRLITMLSATRFSAGVFWRKCVFEPRSGFMLAYFSIGMTVKFVGKSIKNSAI